MKTTLILFIAWLVKQIKKSVWHKRLLARACTGFTLVEMLVVIAMISVMLAALVGLFITLSKSYTTEEVSANAQQDLRAAMNIITRDIRMAGLDPTLSGNFGIITAEDDKVRFTIDTNMNGAIDDYDPLIGNYERITYFYDRPNNRIDQILDEGGAAPEQDELIGYVFIPSAPYDITNDSLDDNPLFSYHDEDGNIIATPVIAGDLSNIREVRLTIKVRFPAGAKGTVERVLSTRIQARNLWF